MIYIIILILILIFFKNKCKSKINETFNNINNINNITENKYLNFLQNDIQQKQRVRNLLF